MFQRDIYVAREYFTPNFPYYSAHTASQDSYGRPLSVA